MELLAEACVFALSTVPLLLWPSATKTSPTSSFAIGNSDGIFLKKKFACQLSNPLQTRFSVRSKRRPSSSTTPAGSRWIPRPSLPFTGFSKWRHMAPALRQPHHDWTWLLRPNGTVYFIIFYARRSLKSLFSAGTRGGQRACFHSTRQ